MLFMPCEIYNQIIPVDKEGLEWSLQTREEGEKFALKYGCFKNNKKRK